MDTSFPWNKLATEYDLTGGHNFEDIAFEYVKDNFKQFNWEKTNETRDGNKDAYAIISVFSTQKQDVEVWMEAKFSLKRNSMNRYTIDNTIVSAISNDAVKELFFVTNMLVSNRVREQVLSALKIDGIEYNNVNFCTKYDLEIWLTNTKQGQHIFSKYFDNCRFEDYQVVGLKVLDNPLFYDSDQSSSLYLEPLSVLRNGLSYNVDLRIYSQANTTIQIRIPNNSIIDSVNPFQYGLHKGINEITLTLSINQTNRNAKTLVLSEVYNEITIEFSIPILHQRNPIIQIESQNTILKSILEDFRHYEKKDSKCVIREITAPAGMGKSYLLKQITGTKYLRNKSIIYFSFSPASYRNNCILAELYLRIFYYSAIFDENIPQNVPQELKDMRLMIANRDDLALNSWMSNANNLQLIPSDYQKDRIIILDNTELLVDSQKGFLKALIKGLSASKSHSFIILSGRQQNFFGNPYIITLKDADVVRSLINNHIRVDSSFFAIVRKVIYDISSLSLVIENYCEEKNYSIVDVLVKTNYKYALKQLMTEKFTMIKSSIDSQSWDMLILVYTLVEGMPYDQVVDDIDLIKPLIEANLIKNGTKCYLPINNLLCSFFRENYTAYNIDTSVIQKYYNCLSYDEQLRFYLGSVNHIKYLDEALTHTNNYLKTHDYISIAYILEPLFSPYNKIDILNESNMSIRLLYNYIYAKANVDTNYEVRKEFDKFAEDIRFNNNIDAIICRIQALSEVVCFSFEDADFAAVLRVTKEAYRISREIHINDNRVKEALYLCDSTRLLTLCAKDKYLEAENLLTRMESVYGSSVDFYVTKARYAKRLFHHNIDKALNILNQTYPILEKAHNDKWSYSCKLDIQLLNYIKGADSEFFVNGINTLRQLLPRYVSHYRSNLRTLAACVLVDTTRKYKKNMALSEFNNYWYEYKNEAGGRFKQEIGCDAMIEAAIAYLYNRHEEMLSKLESARSFFHCFGESYNKIIKHNLAITNSVNLINKRILFYNPNMQMIDNYFYLDPIMG